MVKERLKLHIYHCSAEAVGFEPTDPFGSTVFKTAAIDHSAKPPNLPLISNLQQIMAFRLVPFMTDYTSAPALRGN